MVLSFINRSIVLYQIENDVSSLVTRLYYLMSFN